MIHIWLWVIYAKINLNLLDDIITWLLVQCKTKVVFYIEHSFLPSLTIFSDAVFLISLFLILPQKQIEDIENKEVWNYGNVTLTSAHIQNLKMGLLYYIVILILQEEPLQNNGKKNKLNL